MRHAPVMSVWPVPRSGPESAGKGLHCRFRCNEDRPRFRTRLAIVNDRCAHGGILPFTNEELAHQSFPLIELGLELLGRRVFAFDIKFFELLL
jgi:hypothetical protein